MLKGDEKLDKWIAKNIMHDKYLPKYTSDMNHAIKVLQKLERRHYLYLSTLEDSTTEIFLEETASWGGTELSEISSHKEPATAICLAAYKLETENNWSKDA